jgi:hypothetical protein
MARFAWHLFRISDFGFVSDFGFRISSSASRRKIGGRRDVMPQYALSLKQPWAALLAAGRKTIEVRRWPTARRGRVLIHAARVPDERPEAWKHVPPELTDSARLLGGILGAGDLFACVAYRSPTAFAAEQALHLNDPSWFEPGLYGFRFRALTPLPFRPYAGWMRFFAVADEPTEG